MKKHNYRLAKSSAEDSRPPKRFKSTGDDFVLRKLTCSDKKNTNDEIYESLDLCPVSMALIDTEVFQRLRNICQLGSSQYVYMCANHNRFQHSLGVAHLAEKMCKTIKEEQPQLGATEKDILCVKIAGLLHDIGHGPYSHLYEAFRDNYLPKYLEANPDLKEEYNDCEHLKTISGWSHEKSSLLFIDSMLEELGLQIDLDNLDKPLRQIGDGIDANSMRVFKPHGVLDGVLTSRDFVFIKECINGGPLDGFSYFIGRREQKLEWLYDIVSNRHSGLDVDKIDYFARDHSRAIGKRGIYMKMITDARVAKGLCSRPEKCPSCKGKSEPDLHYMICYPDKHVATVMNFFAHRLYLHETIYQHKTNTVSENMICDILCLADPYLRLQSVNGESFPISRAYLKSDFLVRLDDNILTLIEHSTDERLKEARELCRRLRRHNFYKCTVQEELKVDRPIINIEDLEGKELKLAVETQRDILVWKMSESEIHEGIMKLMKTVGSYEPMEANEFIIKKYYMHHGAGKDNPLMRMRFFEKMNEEQLSAPAEKLPVAKQVEESKYLSILPSAFRKVGIRVLVRDEKKRDIASHLFHTWMGQLEEETRDTKSNSDMKPTSLFFESGDASNSDSDDDDYHERGSYDNPVMLSQDYLEDSSEQNEADNKMIQQDMSPIPVLRTKNR